MTEVTLPDQGPMLQAVGQGIQAFAMVEFGLTTCAGTMLYPAPWPGVRAMLEAVQLETKLRMISAAADAVLDGELAIGWRSLTNRIRRRAKARNKLAHWIVTYWPPISFAADISKTQVGLLPPISSADYWDFMYPGEAGAPKHVRPLDEAYLCQFVESCSKLSIDLAHFARDLRERNDRLHKPSDVKDVEV